MRKLSSFLVFLLTMGIPFVCPGTEPQEKPGAEMTTKQILQPFRDLDLPPNYAPLVKLEV